MLSRLGLLGGKAIGKYIAIAIAVGALLFGIWVVVQSYNKAIEKAAQNKAKFQQANSETEKSRSNNEILTANIKRKERHFIKEQRRLNALARSREKRANGASEELARIFNLMGGDSAVADYKRLLLGQLERGQGEHFDRNKDISDSAASSSRISSAGVPFACFDKRTAEIMLSNATKNADYIEDVERVKADRSAEHPATAANKTE